MEIKNANFFRTYGAVKQFSDDIITILNYSAGVQKPKLTTEKCYNFSNDSEYITIKSTAPALRDLMCLFSVTRTSANFYKYFFWSSDFVEYGTFSALKDIETYLAETYKKLNLKIK